MILIKNLNSHLLFWLFFIYLSSSYQLSGQEKSFSDLKVITVDNILRQDTAVEMRKRMAMAGEQPDTNFTWEKYAAFLTKISDTSKYIVLPLNEFRKTFNSGKIVIGLRHDVDVDLNKAWQFSEIESKLGFRSTYYILHTAPYYLAKPSNMALHSQSIIPILKTMQNDRNFEIGWHNDLVTLQAVYNMDPVIFLHNELAWLRSNGITIYGTASHGSNYCYVYKYLNYYFFRECTYPVVGQFVNNLTLPLNGDTVPMKKGNLSDFNLEYEAYFLNNNKAFSDATIKNGIRWNIGMLNLSQLKTGDRVILLLHPIHWHKASVNANIESFNLIGQRSIVIDSSNSTISVEMPYGNDISSLSASFMLSPGAYARVSGKVQESGSSLNNFSNPLRYVIYAENRDIHKEWIINVHNAKNSECDFKSFSVPGIIEPAIINTVYNTIFLHVGKDLPLIGLKVSFELSFGARAWIGKQEQFNDFNIIDFTNPVEYDVVSRDNQITKRWKVTILQGTNPVESISPDEELKIYPNPTDGRIYMEFRNIVTFPTRIDVFNILGEKVYMGLISETGNFTAEANLSALPAGIYIVKYSNNMKPLMIILRDH